MSFFNIGAIFSGVVNFMNDRMPWNRRQDPEWLISLLGDSPLLGRTEYEYISQVVHSITEEIRSRPDVSSDHHLSNKISVMKNNFEEVAACLRENIWSKNYFLRNYPLWRDCRDKSILHLKYISKSVEENSKDSASIRCFGSQVSLAGGLMCFVPGLGALRLAGGAMMALGSLAAAGASIVEFALLQKKIKEAERILLQDRERSEKLWSWMSDMTHLEEAYNTVTSIDVYLKKIAQDLHACYKEKRTPDNLNTLIAQAVTLLKTSQGIPGDIAEVIGMLVAIFMLHDRYRSLFNIALETFKCKRALSTAYNVATSAAKLAVVHAGKNATFNTFQKYRLGIGIALDVISIIQATKDFEETSKEAVEIANAAKKLKEEANIFEKLYYKATRA